MSAGVKPPRYRLEITTWRWTNSSRDAALPKFFGSIEECYAEVRAARRFLERVGYGIWCAEIYDTEAGDALVGFVQTDPEPVHLAVRGLSG